MKQDPKGQLPGIDLVFADNRTGRIWGTAGVDDMKAGSFVKAQASVRRRVEQQQALDWQISIELEHVVTTVARPLTKFISDLSAIIREEKPGQRAIHLRWFIKKANLSLLSLAESIKIDQEKSKPHVMIDIFEL